MVIFEKAGSPKVGKFAPGTHFPVLSEKNIPITADALILAHNWKKEIVNNLRGAGFKGRFIVPVPKPVIIDG